MNKSVYDRFEVQEVVAYPPANQEGLSLAATHRASYPQSGPCVPSCRKEPYDAH